MADKVDEEEEIPQAEETINNNNTTRTNRSRRHRCLMFTVFTMLLVIFYLFGFIVLLHLEQDIIFVECFTNDHVTRGLNSTALRQDMVTSMDKNVTDDQFSAVYERFAAHFGVSHSHGREERRAVVDICREWLTFTILTLTTVGYGRQTVRSEGGKIFYGIYCCVAMPLTLFYLFTVARFIRRTIECCVALCHCRLSRKGTVYYMEVHLFVITLLLMSGYVALGVVDARYDEHPVSIVNALYFYFVTFTTIGYTDVLVPRSQSNLYSLVVVGGLILVFAFADSTWKLLRKLKDQFCLCHLSCCCCCCRSSGSDDLGDKDSSQSLVDQNAGMENGLHMQRFRYDNATPYVTA